MTIGRYEEALSMQRDAYFGLLKLHGKQHERSLLAANNYASSLIDLQRFKEARSMLRKMIPMARRALGEDDITTLRMRLNYAKALYQDDDLREAVNTLEETNRTARRVLGGAHPLTSTIEDDLQTVRAVLRARETQPSAGGA